LSYAHLVLTKRGPDLDGLAAHALAQGGYFDRGDAHALGVNDALLHYHLKMGRFERIFPGVYRLRHAPVSPHDELLQAWVWSNYRGAISHESALALYGLSDVVPSRVQLTVPPSFRRSGSPFELHWAVLRPGDVMPHEGLQVTTPARSIVDAAVVGTDPEQIQRAVGEALQRGLASAAKLRAAAARPGYRWRNTVLPLIERAIASATT
jgi:predicted transcriptional regulator of viral defense system